MGSEIEKGYLNSILQLLGFFVFLFLIFALML